MFDLGPGSSHAAWGLRSDAVSNLGLQADCAYSFLARRVAWYRKRFVLPSGWPGLGGQLFLRFDGVFHHAQVFLNGEIVAEHPGGYLPFTVRLDNASLLLGPGVNTLAVRADGSYGSGHWYEGGGIYRPVVLVLVPSRHIVEGGLFADPSTDGTTVSVSIELESVARVAVNGAPPGGRTLSTTATRVLIRLFDRAVNVGEVVAETEITIAGTVGTAVLTPKAPLRRWGPQTPATYTLAASTELGDAVNLTFAARTFDWRSSPGKAVLNGEAVVLKGFSHHNSFAGLGSVQPARLSLFKVQLSRALGANFWRMSHNPYDTELYEVLTELGMMAWDEARDYSPEYIADFRAMVKLHRRHPCVVIWSYCNEEECCQLDAALAGRGSAAWRGSSIRTGRRRATTKCTNAGPPTPPSVPSPSGSLSSTRTYWGKATRSTPRSKRCTLHTPRSPWSARNAAAAGTPGPTDPPRIARSGPTRS